MEDAVVQDAPKKKRGPKPRIATPVTETPEFKAALSVAVDSAMQKIVGQLATARAKSGTTDSDPADPDMKWMRQLAMAMAEISDQGTSRKRVAPEVLAKRAEARDHMATLIVEARAKKLKPDYRLVAQVQLNDPKTGPRLLQPFRIDKDKRAVPVEIYWSGVPNEAMRPLNDTAKAIYRAFMESIGGNTDMIKDGNFPADMRAVSVTQGGLVVKGEMSGQRRTVSNLGDPVDDEITKIAGEIEHEESLIEEKPLNDPTREFVPVLGTVHPPARQNYAGK